MSQTIEAAARVVETGQAEEIDGVLLDIQTANVITQVYEALGPANKILFSQMKPETAGKVAWKLATR